MHADLWWKREQHSVVMIMSLLLKTCSKSLMSDLLISRHTFQLFANPFSADVESVSSMLQIELTDLQCNSELKTKFREAQGKADKAEEFLRELPPSFPELSRVFSCVMCLSGSTYMCEKLFSTMNFNKSKYRTRLTDAHLEAVLRVSTGVSTPSE